MQDISATMQDKESYIHRALLKYLDAWSLCPESWEYSLHAGRLLLLQGREREAKVKICASFLWLCKSRFEKALILLLKFSLHDKPSII